MYQIQSLSLMQLQYDLNNSISTKIMLKLLFRKREKYIHDHVNLCRALGRTIFYI